MVQSKNVIILVKEKNEWIRAKKSRFRCFWWRRNGFPCFNYFFLQIYSSILIASTKIISETAQSKFCKNLSVLSCFCGIIIFENLLNFQNEVLPTLVSALVKSFFRFETHYSKDSAKTVICNRLFDLPLMLFNSTQIHFRFHIVRPFFKNLSIILFLSTFTRTKLCDPWKTMFYVTKARRRTIVKGIRNFITSTSFSETWFFRRNLHGTGEGVSLHTKQTGNLALSTKNKKNLPSSFSRIIVRPFKKFVTQFLPS